jgi:DNA-directed RNA polymerase specialized sigma24 family protein
MDPTDSRTKQLAELTEEQKEGARIWLSGNYPYVIKCVSNVLSKPWYHQYKRAYFKEAISEGTEAVFLYHHRYIEGERSLRSWLYRIVSFFIRNFMNRRVIPYERGLCFDQEEYSILDRVAITDDFSPTFERTELNKGVSIWGHKILEDTTTIGELELW